MKADLSKLAERLVAAATPEVLRFSVCSGAGRIVVTDEATVRLLCDVWNARGQIAARLSLPSSEQGNA